MTAYLTTLAVSLLVVGLGLCRFKTVLFVVAAVFVYCVIALGLPVFVSPTTNDTLTMLCFGVFGGVVSISTFGSNRAIAIVASVLSLVLPMLAVYSFVLEPNHLEIRFEKMFSAKVTKPLRIAVLADIQTDTVGPFEKRVIEEALYTKPDLILLPGNYIQALGKRKKEQMALLNRLLKKLKLAAPLGVYATQGDMEYCGGWEPIFSGLDVTIFPKSASVVKDGIRVTGLSLLDSRDFNYVVPESSEFHIVVGHRPDFFLKNPGGDLLVAGHTHGGQIQIPFIGPIKTLTKVPRKWAGGCFFKKRDAQYALISRGIGMERSNAPRVRFWCRPEIVVVDVMPLIEVPKSGTRK